MDWEALHTLHAVVKVLAVSFQITPWRSLNFSPEFFSVASMVYLASCKLNKKSPKFFLFFFTCVMSSLVHFLQNNRCLSAVYFEALWQLKKTTIPFPYPRRFPSRDQYSTRTLILLFKFPLLRHIIFLTIPHVYQTRCAIEKLVWGKEQGWYWKGKDKKEVMEQGVGWGIHGNMRKEWWGEEEKGMM